MGVNSALLSINGAIGTGGQLIGTGTNDSASAGNIGQRLDASAALSSISASTGTAGNIVSQSVPAGDWEISGTAFWLPAASTVISTYQISIGTVSATLATAMGVRADIAFPATYVPTANDYFTQVILPFQVSLAVATTYYFVYKATFTVSTLALGGILHAVKPR